MLLIDDTISRVKKLYKTKMGWNVENNAQDSDGKKKLKEKKKNLDKDRI